MSAPHVAARVLFPGTELQLNAVEETYGLVQIVRHPSGTSYILKCFGADLGSLVEREIAMRKVLRAFTDIEHPNVLDVVELDGEHYMLMDFIEGERLLDRWHEYPSSVPNEMSRLGTLMGRIHAIPLTQAAEILAEDESIYTRKQFSKMKAAMAPFLSSEEQAALSICFRQVTSATPEQVVLHADFGPHQIIVRPDGRWVLFDFEFAMIGPFADDLAGTEVRLERLGFPEPEAFLTAYHEVYSRLDVYEAVRNAFKTYLLLTILSTGISRDGDLPPARDLEQLRRLLKEVPAG